MVIEYKDDAMLTVQQASDVYKRSTLGERRPVDKPETFAAMLDHADVLITAWDGDKLVGVCRTLTDFAYVAYLADLAVDEAYQHQGIGKRMVEITQARLGPDCMVVLLAAPAANDYYPKIGFTHHPRAWIKTGA